MGKTKQNKKRTLERMNREKMHIERLGAGESLKKHSQSNGEQVQIPDIDHGENTLFESQSLPLSLLRRSGANSASVRRSKRAGKRVVTNTMNKRRCSNLFDETSSKNEKCRIARSLATRLLFSLVQNAQDTSALSPFCEIKGQRNQEENKKDVVRFSKSESRPESSSLSFLEVVKKGPTSSPHFSFSPSSSPAVSNAGAPRNSANSANADDVDDGGGNNGGEEEACGACSSLQTSLLLVPEKEEYLPQLISLLRAISFPTISLGSKLSNKGETLSNVVNSSHSPALCHSDPSVVDGVAADDKLSDGKKAVADANCTSACLSLSGVEGEWEEIKLHFNTICRLVQNRDELKLLLDSALSGCWCLHGGQSPNETELFSGDVLTFLPPSLSIMSERAVNQQSLLLEETDANKQSQMNATSTTGVGVADSTLNYNAAPFESRMHSVLATASQCASAGNCLGASTETSAVVAPATSSRCGAAAETKGKEKMTEPGGATAKQTLAAASDNTTTTTSPAVSYLSLPAVTFKLESREEMLRRRNVAQHADAGVSASYYGGRSRGSWSTHVSPSLSFMNPARSQPFCPFDYLLVLDFEATCEENSPPSYLHEIIEFPVVLVDVRLQRSVAEFHRYVKPKVRPQLSEFCRCLTGIKQEDIDKAMPLEDVIRQFERWYSQTVPLGSRTILATDGSTDLREFMYVHSVTRQGIRFPRMFYQWVDVKRVFAHFFQCQQGKIKAMLDVLHCPFEGRLHSGLDDARNIATIVIRMLQLGCSFCEIPLNRLPYSTKSLSPSFITNAAATAMTLARSGGIDGNSESSLAS